MSIESALDLEGMREAGRVTTETLDALQQHVAEGVTTSDLDAVAAAVLARNGARSAPMLVYGFPGTVLISVNDEIVHGIPGQRRLRRGDLVSLDVTVEKDGFIADAARSVIVGDGSRTARALIAAAERSLQAALKVARAGVRVNEIGRAVETEVKRHGFKVVRGLCGHGVGRTIHEEPQVPNEFDRFQKDVLTDGLVLTIEPMISVGSAYPVQSEDGWTLRTKDGSLAAHCEHTLVITKGAPLILAA
ncbi:MAG TPA: type I methionyl aminopeptidase [Vicinamibacterales bacterium]|nr:type I methionyl aminopeptidase [Vicinamibacterales bacterium]